MGADLVALSFVRRPEDVEEVRDHTRLPLIAKIEKPQAVDRAEDILRAADCVMVARGDLGIELPIEEVPLVQKRLLALAGRLARPSITATQMLDSMVTSSRPTRAEVADVANAILDGTDAVMVSQETAEGGHPLRSEVEPAPSHERGETVVLVGVLQELRDRLLVPEAEIGLAPNDRRAILHPDAEQADIGVRCL
jgi:pyruvate kinase